MFDFCVTCYNYGYNLTRLRVLDTRRDTYCHQLTFEVSGDFHFYLSSVMQCNIRVLGGLVSAHILATDSANRLVQGSYKNRLLTLAEDLGRRFLPAFDTPTGLPYAWINLKVLHKICLNQGWHDAYEMSNFIIGFLKFKFIELKKNGNSPVFY